MFFGGLFHDTVRYTASPVQASYVEPVKEPLEAKIDRIAISHNISTTTLYNLIWSESRLDPNAVGDMKITCPSGVNKGKPVRAKGLAQITDCYFPEITDEQAFDPDFAIEFAADQIEKDTAWRHYTECNCYTYIKLLVPHLPAMKDIIPNIDKPIVGGLVLFRYKKGLAHWGYITKITDYADKQVYHIKEANFEGCLKTERDVDSNDRFISGYWVSKYSTTSPLVN